MPPLHSTALRAVRRAAAVILARLARVATRAVRHRGTSLPGMVADLIDPKLACELANELGPVVLVIGTNGKTTTARLIDRILSGASGTAPIANRSGANLRQGVMTALVGASTFRGRLSSPGQAAVFEVDELALESVVGSITPTVIVAVNLFRDQLDRYGEVDAIVARWATVIARLPASTTLVCCADDPRLEALVSTARIPVLRFGLEADIVMADTPANPSSVDPVSCPVCTAPLVGRWRTIGHLGDFCCPNGHFARQSPDITVALQSTDRPDRARLTFLGAFGQANADLALPGMSGAYDAAAAVLAAIAVGVRPHRAVEFLDGATPAFGRLEVAEWLGRQIVLVLVKNAASFAESAEIAGRLRPAAILFGLNDHPADGRDVSWIWDVELGRLENVPAIGLTGDRAVDLALRMKYEGRADHGEWPVVVCPAEPGEALRSIVEHVPAGATVVVLATYTALLGVRSTLERRRVVGAIPA